MRLAAPLAILLAACANEPPPTTEPPPEPPPPEPDLTGPLFDPARVIDVTIELPAADWDALRMQTRATSDIFGSCPTGPHPSPFTTFRATKVTVDGETLNDVGVRKKGFYGSLDEDKPSLKIKSDEYVKGQKFFGLKSLTLNNAKQDPSLIKQCLAYGVFAKAGVPAPRCNFARVRVNGVNLGTYVNVESVNKPFLRRHFTSDEGNLYEGAISDFRPNWTLTFDKKTNENDPDRSDLDEVSDALQKSDSTLLSALDPLVDVEQFLDYWAAEVLIGHSDSYSGLANNFFAYNDPDTGRFVFMPWGVDATFQNGGVLNSEFASVAANGMLTRRLYLLPETRDRYIARLRSHLDTVWDEGELLDEIDRMADLVSAPSAEVEANRQFVRDRRGQITSELAAGPPVWDVPFKPNAKPCFEMNGDVTATFQTTWNTLGAPDIFAAGTGSMTGTIDSAPVVSQRTGSAAGPSEGRVVIQVLAQHANGTFTITFVSIEPAAFVVAAAIPIGGQAAVYRYTPATDSFESIGFVLEGTLRLDAVSQTDGGAVRGSMQVKTLSTPF